MMPLTLLLAAAGLSAHAGLPDEQFRYRPLAELAGQAAVPAAVPAPETPAAALDRLLIGMDADDFKTRQKASAEADALAKGLIDDPAFREAARKRLKTANSLEVQARLGAILGRRGYLSSFLIRLEAPKVAKAKKPLAFQITIKNISGAPQEILHLAFQDAKGLDRAQATFLEVTAEGEQAHARIDVPFITSFDRALVDPKHLLTLRPEQELAVLTGAYGVLATLGPWDAGVYKLELSLQSSAGVFEWGGQGWESLTSEDVYVPAPPQAFCVTGPAEIVVEP